MPPVPQARPPVLACWSRASDGAPRTTVTRTVDESWRSVRIAIRISALARWAHDAQNEPGSDDRRQLRPRRRRWACAVRERTASPFASMRFCDRSNSCSAVFTRKHAPDAARPPFGSSFACSYSPETMAPSLSALPERFRNVSVLFFAKPRRVCWPPRARPSATCGDPI